MVIKEEYPGKWKAKMAMVMTKKKRFIFLKILLLLFKNLILMVQISHLGQKI
jgi:hypothetical protein